MIEKNPSNWNEFKSIITEIRETYGYHEFSFDNDQTYRGKNTVLFRGQQNANWKLQTTLDRKVKEYLTVTQYLSKATKGVHELEAHTNKKWELPDNSTKLVEEMQDDMFGLILPCYEYLAYLRHHGYPSPLLDWSESPYIAAYFAMCDQLDEQSSDHHAAVYAYIDKTGPSKSFNGGPIIKVHGPFASTHKRHFLQKAWYTIALKWLPSRKKHVFCSHHEIFDKTDQDVKQDILIKITIPTNQKNVILKELDDYNLNHFTLFQTEDSLIKKLAVEDFDIEG